MQANKVFFVPGLFGSSLQRLGPNGPVSVWDGDYLRFARVVTSFPDLLEGATWLQPTGIVEVTRIWGKPHEDIYKTLFQFIRSLGYNEQNFFPFPYDWRQSAFHSGKTLAEFIQQRTTESDRVALVSHSFGTRVVRTAMMLGQTEIRSRISKVIEIAPPHRGSSLALQYLISLLGLGTLQRILVTFLGGSARGRCPEGC